MPAVLILVVLVAGWPWPQDEPAPVIVRPPVDPFARQYVYFFAILPAFVGTLVAVLIGVTGPVGGVAPLVVLSGLAVVIAAGDAIHFGRQHIVIATWFGLVLLPPIMTVVALYAAPWFNVDLKVTEPAGAMARFFAESFERRVGAPLRIVAGEPRTAALVALGPSRPSLYLNATPQRSPWVTPEAWRQEAPSSSGRPPTRPARRPTTSSRASRSRAGSATAPSSARPQGRLPLMRIGWGVIRPQAQPPRHRRPARYAAARRSVRALTALSDSLRRREPCRGTANRRTRCSRAPSAAAQRFRPA